MPWTVWTSAESGQKTPGSSPRVGWSAVVSVDCYWRMNVTDPLPSFE
jgi:hypothetical protein